MMDARTILIFESLDIGDFRPITVLGCLIRIHSKFAAFFTMSVWASKLPASVCGGVPGRDIKVFTWLQQFDVELSLIEGTDMGGFLLDLARAFNTIPCVPLAALMKKMGISARDVDFWIDSLGGMRRSLAFKGTLGPYISSGTGIPEGDAMSVAAMTCLSYLYVKCMEAVHVAAFVYVDNLAYHSDHTAPLANALDSTVIFAEAVSLTVDWNKSWCWGTTQRMKDFWINSDTSCAIGVGVGCDAHLWEETCSRSPAQTYL